jgi:Ku protein
MCHGCARELERRSQDRRCDVPVALFTAASTSERVAFHVLNRKTGHRVHREFVDSETGKPVEAKDQVKGYETGRGDYLTFEPDEIAQAIPDRDKTLDVQAFIPCSQVDDIYFDRPYYLAADSPAGAEAFALIREGLAAAKVVAIARSSWRQYSQSVVSVSTMACMTGGGTPLPRILIRSRRCLMASST